MFFALCRCELFLPEGRSLKAKRSVIHGLRERLRARFHASVAEVDGQDLHQRGALGIAFVGLSPSALEEGLAAMRRLIELETRCQILAWETRVERFEPGPPATAAAAAWDEAEDGDEFFGPFRGRRPDGEREE
jgi:uncharacterized protein YlxP (DUF503 family)